MPTPRTPTELYAEISTQLASAQPGGITGLQLRTVVNNIVASAMGGAVNIRWHGATIDGSDDTVAIAAAITAAGPGGAVYFPKGTGNSKISVKLVQLANQTWYADDLGSFVFEKAANIDLIDMGDYGKIENIKIDCKGATYTGRGIHVVSGFLQQLRSLDVRDSAGVAIEVGSNAGVGMVMDQIYATTTSPLTVAAIKLPVWFGVGGEPRFLTNIWLSGGFLDMRGVNTGSVVGGYVHHIQTDADSANFHIANIRYASAGAAITISGSDCLYVNCAFAGTVAFVDCQGIEVSNPNFGFGFTEDPATCQYNSIFSQATLFTPVWDQASGTQPALGDGTLVGRWQRNGHQCLVQVRLVFGATTTGGNNATAYRFSLPFPGHQSYDQRIVGAYFKDASTGTNYIGYAVIGANDPRVSAIDTGQGIRLTYPVDPFAVGDVIEFSLSYLVR